MSEALRRTPLYQRQLALGARMVAFAGWELPVQYAGILPEHHAVRNAVGLFDVSHMGELHFEGDAAARCLDALVTNDIGRLRVGRALYTVACDAAGHVLDDLIVYRLAQTHLLVVCNASNRDKMRAHFGQAVAGRCQFNDRSDDTALLALQGPRAVDVARALAAPDAVLTLPRFGVLQTQLAGAPLTIARTGYTGEDGYELFVGAKDAESLWQRLLDAGAAYGIAPIGLGARDTLRLEARLSLYGHEIDETTDPLEAGLGWVVKFDKGEFLGREALWQKKQSGPTRRLVGFEMTGRGIARQGYPILDAVGARVGHVTSGAPSPSLGKNIGLGYVPTAKCAVGTTLGIEIRGKVIEAKVCPTPFYKRT